MNGIPHVQTLREFPREELFGKVVMVRFDSNILVKKECDKKNQSVSNAIYTIKYLHKAGAKVILVSDWNMNTPELHMGSVTGTFLKAFCSILVVSCHVWLLCHQWTAYSNSSFINGWKDRRNLLKRNCNQCRECN